MLRGQFPCQLHHIVPHFPNARCDTLLSNVLNIHYAPPQCCQSVTSEAEQSLQANGGSCKPHTPHAPAPPHGRPTRQTHGHNGDPAAPYLSTPPHLITYGCAGTLQGDVCQISFAYSAMVRSEEKKPLPAVDMMDISVHRAWSWYVASTRACAPRITIWHTHTHMLVSAVYVHTRPFLASRLPHQLPGD